MFFSSVSLVALLLPFGDAADLSASKLNLRGTKALHDRELQNIDHLGGSGGAGDVDLSDLADVANNVQNGNTDITELINGAIQNAGNLPGMGNVFVPGVGSGIMPGAGSGNIPGVGNGGNIPDFSNQLGGIGGGNPIIPPTIIGSVGGGDIVENIGGVLDSVGNVIPGIPNVDLTSIPSLPEDFMLPDISNINIPSINITDLANIAGSIPDAIVDNIPDGVMNNINTVTGEVGQVPGDVCESVQNMTPEEAQALFESLNYTLPANFTVPADYTLPTDYTLPDNITIPINRPEDIALGQNLTFGENLTIGENFTIGENYTLPTNLTLPESVSFNPQNFLQTYVNEGKIPCPVNGTFAPGTTLPPQVTQILQNIAGNYSVPDRFSEPDRCSSMPIENVTLFIKVMPDIDDGLECATNFFRSLGSKQTRNSINGRLTGEFTGVIQFYHGPKPQWALASTKFKGMTCDVFGDSCTHNVRFGLSTDANVVFKRLCPFGDRKPCNVVSFNSGLGSSGKIFYIRKIEDGRWISLVKHSNTGPIMELTSLISKDVVNGVISDVTSTVTEVSSNVAPNVDLSNVGANAGGNNVGLNGNAGPNAASPIVPNTPLAIVPNSLGSQSPFP